MPLILEIVLALVVLMLLTALIVNERRHRKIELALLDRVLQSAGLSPLEPPPPAPVVAKVEPRKLRFRVG